MHSYSTLLQFPTVQGYLRDGESVLGIREMAKAFWGSADLGKSPLRADANRGSSNVGFAKRERRRVQNPILGDSNRRTPRESSGAAANRLPAERGNRDAMSAWGDPPLSDGAWGDPPLSDGAWGDPPLSAAQRRRKKNAVVRLAVASLCILLYSTPISDRPGELTRRTLCDHRKIPPPGRCQPRQLQRRLRETRT